MEQNNILDKTIIDEFEFRLGGMHACRCVNVRHIVVWMEKRDGKKGLEMELTLHM